MITKADEADYIHIVRAVQNKKLDYLTCAHIRQDISQKCLYKFTENNKIIAICSIVFDEKYQYHAVKRLCIFSIKNKGKHITEKFLDFFSQKGYKKIGCTPWSDNAPMRHILEKKGFVLEYIFSEKWCFYSRS